MKVVVPTYHTRVFLTCRHSCLGAGYEQVFTLSRKGREGQGEDRLGVSQLLSSALERNQPSAARGSLLQDTHSKCQTPLECGNVWLACSLRSTERERKIKYNTLLKIHPKINVPRCFVKWLLSPFLNNKYRVHASTNQFQQHKVHKGQFS